jgi:hypothetical protein
VYAHAQYHFVTTSNSFDATAFNNSHKIVTQNGEWMSDTIHVVYHSSDSVYYIFTTDEGISWQTPVAFHEGICPALDVDTYGFRHVAWQYFHSGSGNYEVYYDCLDDWAPPINVSESSGNSILPDLVIDSSLVVHITWTEDVDGYNQIFYRSCDNGVLSDTFRISDYGSVQATNSHSSISIFQPDNRIYILWACVDTSSYTPYHILYRYKEGSNWSITNSLAEHWHVLRHPSLDFCHGLDSLSACWEDSTSGNLEAFFYGGNPGGGYPTQGHSMYPVISTVGENWSYVFWQEDSSGYIEINYNLYYLWAGGWYDGGSLRALFNISEPIRFPNCCGAYLIWTQGQTSPYSLYFADFEYPIGIENTKTECKTISLSIAPNPFSKLTNIKFQTPSSKSQVTMSIYDATGRLARSFPVTNLCNPNKSVVSVYWDGTDDYGKELPTGTYFCILNNNNESFLKKVVKLK